MTSKSTAVQEPDEELIERLKKGEKSALDSIMNRYQQPIYFFILRYVHDEDLAYDLVQETFFRVYTRCSSYKPEYRFKTWLFQIALNLCRDNGRKQALRSFFSFSEEGKENVVDSKGASPLSVEEQIDTENQIQLMHRAIAELPHKLKSALILFALEEKSQLHCGKILGISAKAVETRVYRAKKELAKKMERQRK